MSNLGVMSFETLLSGAKPTRLPGSVSWRKPKYSARRIADMSRSMRLDETQLMQLRTSMGRSPVKTRAYRLVNKGHKHERNRIARLELIESRLKEIPKIEQQHKAQVERDRIRMSKKFKGINLVYTPDIITSSRADASLIKRRIMPPTVELPPNLLRIAQNKHLTALPPHLQAELDRLRAARDAAAAAAEAKAAAAVAEAKK